MNSIQKAIKETTGLKISEFCEKEMDTQYKAFFARMRNGKLYPAEIFYIVYKTKKSVQELFGKNWHELLISGQGGTVADKVRGLIETMDEKEKEEMSALLGFGAYIEKAKEREEVKEIDVKNEITKHPDEAQPEPPKDLSSFFIKTY